jgi:hypothetical protein
MMLLIVVHIRPHPRRSVRPSYTSYPTFVTPARSNMRVRSFRLTPAALEEIERSISRWGGDSAFIEVNETELPLLRILPA